MILKLVKILGYILNKYHKYNAWYNSLETFKDSKITITMLKFSETDIDSSLECLPEIESLPKYMIFASTILPD